MNDRAKLELEIIRYRLMAKKLAADPREVERLRELIADLEKKLREIDE